MDLATVDLIKPKKCNNYRFYAKLFAENLRIYWKFVLHENFSDLLLTLLYTNDIDLEYFDKTELIIGAAIRIGKKSVCNKSKSFSTDGGMMLLTITVEERTLNALCTRLANFVSIQPLCRSHSSNRRTFNLKIISRKCCLTITMQWLLLCSCIYCFISHFWTFPP